MCLTGPVSDGGEGHVKTRTVPSSPSTSTSGQAVRGSSVHGLGERGGRDGTVVRRRGGLLVMLLVVGMLMVGMLMVLVVLLVVMGMRRDDGSDGV